MSKLKRSDMQKLDLDRILKTAKLKNAYVAPILFPDNKFPMNAIQRVRRGEAFLDSEQIAKLSELLNVPIGLLFDGADWEMLSNKDAQNMIRFRAYDYYAELNTKTMTTRVSLNGKVFFESITHNGGTTISEYLSSLTDLIIKYR